jgi:hypothetical protein
MTKWTSPGLPWRPGERQDDNKAAIEMIPLQETAPGAHRIDSRAEVQAHV